MAAYTQEQLEAARAQYARMIVRAEYGDRSITYGSLEDQRKTIAVMEAALASASTSPPARRSFVTFSRR